VSEKAELSPITQQTALCEAGARARFLSDFLIQIGRRFFSRALWRDTRRFSGQANRVQSAPMGISVGECGIALGRRIRHAVHRCNGGQGQSANDRVRKFRRAIASYAALRRRTNSAADSGLLARATIQRRNV